MDFNPVLLFAVLVRCHGLCGFQQSFFLFLLSTKFICTIFDRHFCTGDCKFQPCTGSGFLLHFSTNAFHSIFGQHALELHANLSSAGFKRPAILMRVDMALQESGALFLSVRFPSVGTPAVQQRAPMLTWFPCDPSLARNGPNEGRSGTAEASAGSGRTPARANCFTFGPNPLTYRSCNNELRVFLWRLRFQPMLFFQIFVPIFVGRTQRSGLCIAMLTQNVCEPSPASIPAAS